jgi:hypothetical protein
VYWFRSVKALPQKFPLPTNGALPELQGWPSIQAYASEVGLPVSWEMRWPMAIAASEGVARRERVVVRTRVDFIVVVGCRVLGVGSLILWIVSVWEGVFKTSVSSRRTITN